MNPIRQQIIEICINSDAEGIELVRLLEVEIAKLIPYKHDSAVTEFESCGLDTDEIRVELRAPADSKPSELIERIENSLTKREIAIGFFKQMSTKEAAKSSMEDPLEAFLKSMLERLGSPEESDRGIEDVSFEGFTPPSSPDKCHEEDQSECWRCPHKGECIKFD